MDWIMKRLTNVTSVTRASPVVTAADNDDLRASPAIDHIVIPLQLPFSTPPLVLASNTNSLIYDETLTQRVRRGDVVHLSLF
jgi:hypothetical protein